MPPDHHPDTCDSGLCRHAADDAVRKDLRFGQSMRRAADRGAVMAFAGATDC